MPEESEANIDDTWAACADATDDCDDTETECLQLFTACLAEAGEDTSCLDAGLDCLSSGEAEEECFAAIDLCFAPEDAKEDDKNIEAAQNELDDDDANDFDSPNADILAIGDSILEWNEWEQSSIPEIAGQLSNMTVKNAAVSGMAFLGEAPDTIPSLYTPSNYKAVILNGGINDLQAGCTADGSMPVVDSIIAPSGQSGPMFDLVESITQSGAKVILVGYFEPYEYFEGCVAEVVALNARYAALAQNNSAVTFVDTSSVITPTMNVQHYDADKLHPSVSGSAAIAQLVADALSAF